MSSKGWKWSACIIVLLFFLLFRLPVIQLDFGHDVYFLNQDSFRLKWIHSVEKEEWIELYERERGELLLTETFFKTFGAGVPSDADQVKTEDGFVKMKIDRYFKEINIAVSENVKSTIVTEKAEIPLYEFTDDYENVNISITYLHLWDLIGGKFL